MRTLLLFLFACALPAALAFDTIQDCRAWEAVVDPNAECTIPAESPHFIWFSDWTIPGLIDTNLIVDPTRQLAGVSKPPGYGQFLRDSSGDTTIRAALCSDINCPEVKFDVTISLTGYQPTPATLAGWAGSYPITGGIGSFGAAATTPKKELALNSIDFPSATGDCQCDAIVDCPLGEEQLASDFWEFYTSSTLTQMDGIITGIPSTLTDGIEIEFTLFHKTGTLDYLKSPQRGYGANDKNDNDGMGMWFNWRVNSYPTNAAIYFPDDGAWGSDFNFDSGFKGDINIELDCTGEVTDSCVDLGSDFDCQRAHEDGEGACIEVVTSTSSFRATGDHLILTPTQGWRLVREIRVGDTLRSGIVESVRDTVCKSLNTCITDNQRFDAFGEVFAQNALITPDNYQWMKIQ